MITHGGEFLTVGDGDNSVTRVMDSAAAVKLSPKDFQDILACAIGAIGGVGKQRARPATGPKALMFAVLEEAVRSYFSRKVRVREEAERWIRTRNARTLFSFSVVCETLDLDPDELSSRLHRLRRQVHCDRDVRTGVSPVSNLAPRPAQQILPDQVIEPMLARLHR